MLGVSQACAGVISTNSDATAFWLDDAQQAVLANEHGSDASPLFMGGARPAESSTQHQTHAAAQRISVRKYSIKPKS